MSLQNLDFIFPFVVFFYGLLLLVVQESPFFRELGHQRMSVAYQRISTQRPLAWISFFGGGLWALQNIWFT